MVSLFVTKGLSQGARDIIRRYTGENIARSVTLRTKQESKRGKNLMSGQKAKPGNSTIRTGGTNVSRYYLEKGKQGRCKILHWEQHGKAGLLSRGTESSL